MGVKPIVYPGGISRGRTCILRLNRPSLSRLSYDTILPGFPGVCLLNAPTSVGGGAGMKAPTRF